MHEYFEYESEVEGLLACIRRHPTCCGEGLIGHFTFLYVPTIVRSLISISAMKAINIVVDTHDGRGMYGGGGIGYFGLVRRRGASLLLVSFTVRKPKPEEMRRQQPGAVCKAMRHVPSAPMLMGQSPQSVRFVIDSGASHVFVNTLRGVILDETLPRVSVQDGQWFGGSGPIQWRH
jgi:hypothetical protein